MEMEDVLKKLGIALPAWAMPTIEKVNFNNSTEGTYYPIKNKIIIAKDEALLHEMVHAIDHIARVTYTFFNDPIKEIFNTPLMWTRAFGVPSGWIEMIIECAPEYWAHIKNLPPPEQLAYTAARLMVYDLQDKKGKHRKEMEDFYQKVWGELVAPYFIAAIDKLTPQRLEAFISFVSFAKEVLPEDKNDIPDDYQNNELNKAWAALRATPGIHYGFD